MTGRELEGQVALVTGATRGIGRAIALARQAASPVRWTETVRAIAARGVTDVIEAGPGRVLAGLARKIDASLRAHALTDGHALADAKAAIAAGTEGTR